MKGYRSCLFVFRISSSGSDVSGVCATDRQKINQQVVDSFLQIDGILHTRFLRFHDVTRENRSQKSCVREVIVSRVSHSQVKDVILGAHEGCLLDHVVWPLEVLRVHYQVRGWERVYNRDWDDSSVCCEWVFIVSAWSGCIPVGCEGPHPGVQRSHAGYAVAFMVKK